MYDYFEGRHIKSTHQNRFISLKLNVSPESHHIQVPYISHDGMSNVLQNDRAQVPLVDVLIYFLKS